MSEFKPGDRVVWSGKEVELLERDEGRWSVRYAGVIHHNVRPSELTRADAVPDAATLLVRELCAAEVTSNESALLVMNGNWDDYVSFRAFAKYIRANSLTVGRDTRARPAYNLKGQP